MDSARSEISTTGRILAPLPLRSAMAAIDFVAPPLAAQVARTMFFRPRSVRAHRTERAVLDRGERFVIQDEGRDVVGRSWGTGPVVALVHGWNGHLGQLTPMVEPLVSKGFRVVGFDWPGHGDSAPSAASALHAARVLLQLQRLFGPFHAVVAHSFGSVATLFARTRGLHVDRLMFFAPVARLERYLEEFSSAFRFSDPQRARFVASCEAWLRQPFRSFEPLEVAASVHTPVRILHSRDDREVDVNDVVTLSTRLSADLHQLEGLGHRRLLRDQDCIESAVGFVVGS